MEVHSGHGTHVCGTIAGNITDSTNSYYNHAGHAPAAKIAFFDMVIYNVLLFWVLIYLLDIIPQENSNSQYFTMPSPIGDNVFGPAYQAGARIHSNSWGGAFNGSHC